MIEHAGRREIERYVIDALDPAPRARLEAHLLGCRACAAALTEEARFEETLRTALPQVRRPPAEVVPLRPSAAPPPPRRRTPAFALAAAAALVLSVGILDREPPSELSPDGGSAAICVAAVSPPAAEVCGLEPSDLACSAPPATGCRTFCSSK